VRIFLYRRPEQSAATRAYLLTEALVYIGVVVLILGVAYAAVYRCIDASLVLRRGAEDIAAGLRAGELWRTDIRSSESPGSVVGSPDGTTLELKGSHGMVAYRFEDGVLSRRVGSGTWVAVLKNVKASSFHSDARNVITGWRWELELQPRSKAEVRGSRIPLLFTFLAMPGGKS
jgi:hypothetical protein